MGYARKIFHRKDTLLLEFNAMLLWPNTIKQKYYIYWQFA